MFGEVVDRPLEQAELVSLRVGEDHPRVLRRLADVHATGSEGLQALQFFSRGAIFGPEVEVQAVLDGLRFGHLEDVDARPRPVRCADRETVLLAVDDAPAQDLAPEGGDRLGIVGIDDDNSKPTGHRSSMAARTDNRLRFRRTRPNADGMDAITIRPAAADDASFIEDMLVEAANTPSHPDRNRSETLALPDIAHYAEGWPRETDLGVIAVGSEELLGAAWLRYFTESAPAHGFVAADVPELAIGVERGSRGRGVGRKLLHALFEAAELRGIQRISLSVERANPAIRLYSSEGFETVGSREHADTMLRVLRR